MSAASATDISSASASTTTQAASNAAVLTEAKRHKWRLILTPVVTALVITAFALYKHFCVQRNCAQPAEHANFKADRQRHRSRWRDLA